MMSVFQLVLVTLSLLTLSAFKWLTRKQKVKLPPSPLKLPIIGNFHQLGNYPYRSLSSLAQEHGPLMLLHFGQVPVLVISSSNVAREIMKTYDQIFCSRPKATMPDKLLYGSKDVGFAPYDEYWRQVKSICVLNLLSNRRVQSFKKIREEEISAMVDKFTDASSNNHLINIPDVFKSLTNDVVSRVSLGFRLGETEKGRRFNKYLIEEGELLGYLCIGDYVPWLWWVDRVNGLLRRADRLAKGLDYVLQSIIDDHIEKAESHSEGEGKNFVEILLETQRKSKLGFSISTDSIKAVLLDMFNAGTDTTYTLMEWTVAELLRQPRIMKKLQNEVRQIVGSKPNVSEEDLEKMSYLKMVIKESLRLHPPIPLLLPRESTQNVNVLGYDIKAGTQAVVNVWAIGRDPLVWEEPDEFKPERFLKDPVDFTGLNFKLVPFGGGRRGCPGIQFAMVVAELALATLFKKFDIALPEGVKAEDVDMSESTGMSCHMKSPLLVVATPRL